jgi:hypothetical protein
MNVHKAGGDDQAPDINFRRPRPGDIADFDDPAVDDCHVGFERIATGPIEDRAPAKYEAIGQGRDQRGDARWC